MAEPTATTTASPETRIAELEAQLAVERAVSAKLLTERDQVVRERDQLRASHERLRLELELLKRRIFVAKAERVSAAQLELEFAAKSAELDRLTGELTEDGAPPTDTTDRGGETDVTEDAEEPAETDGEPPPKGPRRKPTGRRNLRNLELPEERIELSDPLFEDLVAQGKAERIGFEESCKAAWQRGGTRRLVVARVKYRTIDAEGNSAVEVTPMPPETLHRSLAAPSMLAHVLSEKYCDGLAFFRVEERLSRDGFPIDRGTLSRWAEDAGATIGATIVFAMKADAKAHAFCIATDATGVAVLPTPNDDKGHQPCRRGHFFVLVADQDHIIFEYTAKHTSEFVKQMLHGYSGYVQADANSVYDALFRPPGLKDSDEERERPRPSEVGCWCHCRRGFWEAATTTKDPLALEGLLRIRKIFELDATWKKKPPKEIRSLRNLHLRPHMEAFFTWAAAQYELVRERRCPLRSAVGYAVRQREPLMRVLEDGRLPLENNRSERGLRRIATGRKVWLFCGSDDHADSAANLFTVIASARLHQLDPELYLRDILRVLAQWPRDRYLELAPKHWARTRAALDPAELALEVGPLTIPPPLDLHSPANANAP